MFSRYNLKKRKGEEEREGGREGERESKDDIITRVFGIFTSFGIYRT